MTIIPIPRCLVCLVLLYSAFLPADLYAQSAPREREIAARFAPVFYQALGENPRSDYITNFDFDGDWIGNNNWENTDEKKYPLLAFVYYSVSETPTHYFIHYAVFHPRDYKGGEQKGRILSDLIREGVKLGGEHDPTGWMAEAGVAHENDLEGALVVVEKRSKGSERLLFVETLHHNNFSPCVAAEVVSRDYLNCRTDDEHVLLYVEPKGHGIERYIGDEKQAGRKEFLIYSFTGRAEDPDKQPDGFIGYDLVPIQNTLWAKARDISKEKPGVTYANLVDYPEISIKLVGQNGKLVTRKIKPGKIGSNFQGDTGSLNMARAPWAWFDKNHRNETPGLWFFDPASVIKRDFRLDDSFSTAYVRLPFWAEH